MGVVLLVIPLHLLTLLIKWWWSPALLLLTAIKVSLRLTTMDVLLVSQDMSMNINPLGFKSSTTPTVCLVHTPTATLPLYSTTSTNAIYALKDTN